jgi:hypothetical protein
MVNAISELQDTFKRTLRALGASAYSSHVPETRFLASILEEGEVVLGVVFGHYKHPMANLRGRGALAATNYRILLIDKKPLFMRFEELGYAIVSGVTWATTGLYTSVTLETRAGNISIATYSTKSATTFTRAVEEKAIKVDPRLKIDT